MLPPQGTVGQIAEHGQGCIGRQLGFGVSGSTYDRPEQNRCVSFDVILGTLASFLVSAQRASSTSAPTPTSTTSSSTSASSTLWLLFWWRPNKCEVDRNRLVEKFSIVQGLDGSFRFWLCWIFNQSISLPCQINQH